ncbi:CMD domain protein [Agrococcus sp. TF02-05]|uniref:CMD domain protein n=1 Tax=Agrococcus sp. TF02-05 TaxID=2815211 RepID=UPI001AA0E340|nr:CMD domain protein [Agrococcus sp. TF02-05]MBO1768622.1 CMD domain protein [Agrococcus sp. TF02-05]
MSHDDVIDHLAGIRPGSPLARIRLLRPDAREHAQRSFLALLEPDEPGQLRLVDRYAVAAFVALLHDASTERSRASAFYLELLADEAEPAIVDAVARAADSARASGPYGRYRESALHGESVVGPAAALDRAALGAPLAAALEHAHLLTLHPRDARPEALRALEAAGWGADAVVSLSQLVAFLAFQLRLVHGLRVLAAHRAAAPAADAPDLASTTLQETRA